MYKLFQKEKKSIYTIGSKLADLNFWIKLKYNTMHILSKANILIRVCNSHQGIVIQGSSSFYWPDNKGQIWHL